MTKENNSLLIGAGMGLELGGGLMMLPNIANNHDPLIGALMLGVGSFSLAHGLRRPVFALNTLGVVFPLEALELSHHIEGIAPFVIAVWTAMGALTASAQKR